MDSSADHKRIRLILSTVDSPEEAERLSHLWVQSHRAVCVSAVPGVVSVYPWEGKVQEASEILLLIKTSVRDESEVPALLRSLAADHPYDEPELLVLGADGSSPGYLQWLLAWTGEKTGPSDPSTEGGA